MTQTSAHRFDLVIAGGGTGGVAAALAALAAGLRVALTEETDWIGGQLTQQAVPPDEHRWIESFGCTRGYRRFRNEVRTYYRRHYPLKLTRRSDPHLNPGMGWVSRLCFEPRVGLAVLEAFLAPYEASGQLRVFLRSKVEAVDVQGDRVRAITMRHLVDGHRFELTAPFFLDATECGDLLPLAGAEYVTGTESRSETHEPHAPEAADPANMQGITWCPALDYRAGEDHTIERPTDYAFWRDHLPRLDPPWPGKLLAWDYFDAASGLPRSLPFDPSANDPHSLDLWTYRRVRQAASFELPDPGGDISLINWPQNDYFLGNIFDLPEDEARRHLEGARQLSLSLVHWLQTEAPRADGGQGWPGLRLRGDVVGTTDGLAKYPYIRESRRIRAEFTVTENHVGLEARMAETGQPRDTVTAATFADSVGIGCYRIDLHPATGGVNGVDIASLPFQIPLGALLPLRMENLLPAAKNLGVTHITNGCFRLHPVEWNIGEAAGLLAAFCLRAGCPPRAVRTKPELLRAYQADLENYGIPLAWPRITPV
ncbi:MAG: FAD-dependent oxidoreductase [Puniceicoccaceae bacterium]|nr:MAG: FAD-dependent oxidoreductase [Puniceicoccaceae bacterium]